MRKAVAALLGILATLMTVATPLCYYAKENLADTAWFVRTVQPLSTDDDVKNTISDEILNMIPSFVRDALTDKVDTVVKDVTKSSAFRQGWAAGVREAHTQAVDVLSGKSNETVNDNSVTLDLPLGQVGQSVVKALSGKAEAVLNGLNIIDGSIPVSKISDLSYTRLIYSIVMFIGSWGILMSLILWVATIAIAPRHVGALGWCALAIVATAVVDAIVAMWLKGQAVDAFSSKKLPSDLVSAVYNSLSSDFFQWCIAIGVAGLVFTLICLGIERVAARNR